MTYYELIYWCSAAFVFVGLLFMGSCAKDTVQNVLTISTVMTIVYLTLGGLVGVIFNIGYTNDAVEKCRVEIRPISTVISEGGLDVVMSDHTHFTFTDYKDVEKFKNGGKLYMSYRYCQVPFGVDIEENKLIIE